MLSSSSVSRRHLAAMNFLLKSSFLLLAYFTCCIWAWPVAESSAYRSQSNANTNYIPYASNIAYEPDYQDNYNLYNNQWERAKEPEPQLSYYDALDDYLGNSPAAMNLNDIEAFSELSELYNPPVWGQIVKEKPENELEELKAEERLREAEAEERRQALEDQYKYYAYDFSGHPDKRGPASLTNAGPTTTTTAPVLVSGKTKSPAASATAAPLASKGASTASPKPVRLLHQQPGMKEVPLLRPPNKAKILSDHLNEPVINVAQRSVAEKPSAYDTLRKYLSLEDALKKEADKRRGNANRIQKRTPMGKKQIVSDIDSLSGQLHSLKKTV